MRVFDKQTSRQLSDAEIIEEVNRDRTEEWQPYTELDLKKFPSDILDWIDLTYYEVKP